MMSPPSAGHATERSTEARSVFGLALLAFLIACVFDPADKLLGAKVWIFLLCWLLSAGPITRHRRRAEIPAGLLAYTATFISIPALSVAWYVLRDGSEPYEGFSMLKGYVLITFASLLVLTRVDLLRQLSAVLTLMAVGVIAVFIALMIVPELYVVLLPFGGDTGFLMLDKRDYGSDVTLLQVHFSTSPMLAISIAYYFDRFVSAQSRKAKIRCFTLLLINAIGMLLAGTRNNILVSMLLPVALWFYYTRYRLRGALLSLGVVLALLVLFRNELGAFFDPTEVSNSAKLALLNDYSKLFEDPIVLLFGQGLGAYSFWEGRGSLAVTELTYHEMIRSFGLFGAAAMLALLLVPIIQVFVLRRRFQYKGVLMGYGAYLIMCISNPLLFSSMGILLLSVILAKIYLAPATLRSLVARPVGAPSQPAVPVPEHGDGDASSSTLSKPL